MILGGKRILRVFARRTSHTPTDEYAVIGEPGLFIPQGIDEVHVSCVFSWDKNEAARLAHCWRYRLPRCEVKVGGPAFGSPCDTFTPGLYVREGITYTTRGCDMDCPWCLVQDIEGPFRELPEVAPGNIVQDNNILLAGGAHLRRVFRMLRRQKGIRFVGGLDVRFLEYWHVRALRKLSVHEIWLAFDDVERVDLVASAIAMLRSAGFRRRQIRCYVMAGWSLDEPDMAEDRCQFAWHCGALPFAQLFQPSEARKEYSQEWRDWQRRWSRPAASFAHMKRGLALGT